MADYGQQVGIPNGTNPGQAPQPIPQGTPSPQQDSGHQFDEDSLGKAFDQIKPSQGQQNQPDPNDVKSLQSSNQPGQPNNSQWSGVNAQGSPSQLAQASIGRNINERLQIWSKLVGDSNAMIGPPINGQNDIWIRGQDQKFHPADTGHTDFMQDVAKKTGAGIDLTTQSVSAIAAGALGTLAGAPEVGAAIGYMAGPGLSSYARQFIMSRKFDVRSDPAQLQRDMYIGGALNLMVGGVMGAMSSIASNVAESITSGPANRMAKVANAQIAAKNFMDVVGAKPSEIITEDGIEAPMSDAGARLWSATQLKRKQLNDLLGTANEQIIAASPAKIQTQGLASVVKGFMQKEGYRFDDNGMPIPYEGIPLGSEAIVDQESRVFAKASEMPLSSVSSARINRPKMGAEAMNDLAEDYKALASGQLDTKNFLQMIRDWQENANFKMLDQRSDATRSGWAELQHMATSLRQNEIQSRLGSDPEMLKAVNNAYHEYSSSKDAIDMIYDAYKNNQNSPEKLAQTFIQPGKKTLLSQAQSLFADKPEIMRDIRSSWLSEKMGSHVGSDGIFNANSFIADLKSTGGETLNQLFKPEELGSIYRASKIMGSIKTSDLMSQAQGQNVVDALGDVAKASSKATLSKPWAIMDWLSNKPKLADYVSSPEGLTKLAAKQDPQSAAIMNGMSSILRNKISQSAASVAIKSNYSKAYNQTNINNFMGQIPAIAPPTQGSLGSDAAAQEVMK